jgi:hypothetical protein
MWRSDFAGDGYPCCESWTQGCNATSRHEEAFEAAITPRPANEIVEGETRPRQRFFLHGADV